jgi:hypothetical protein
MGGWVGKRDSWGGELDTFGNTAGRGIIITRNVTIKEAYA